LDLDPTDPGRPRSHWTQTLPDQTRCASIIGHRLAVPYWTYDPVVLDHTRDLTVPGPSGPGPIWLNWSGPTGLQTPLGPKPYWSRSCWASLKSYAGPQTLNGLGPYRPWETHTSLDPGPTGPCCSSNATVPILCCIRIMLDKDPLSQTQTLLDMTRDGIELDSRLYWTKSCWTRTYEALLIPAESQTVLGPIFYCYWA
jgi:hypothetical protein